MLVVKYSDRVHFIVALIGPKTTTHLLWKAKGKVDVLMSNNVV